MVQRTILKVTPELHQKLEHVYNNFSMPASLKRQLSTICHKNPSLQSSHENLPSRAADGDTSSKPNPDGLAAEIVFQDHHYISFNLLMEFSTFMIGQERKALLAVENNIIDLSRSKYWLHELIKDCRLFIEPVKPIERSANLTASLQQLQDKLDKSEYDRMISSVVNSTNSFATGHEHHNHLPGLVGSVGAALRENIEDLKMTRQQICMIINVIFSVIGCYFAFFWILSSLTTNTEVRFLASFLGAFVVGFAEVWLYLAYFRDSSRFNRGQFEMVPLNANDETVPLRISP